jgi:hypothetical protein
MIEMKKPKKTKQQMRRKSWSESIKKSRGSVRSKNPA